ncbi:MAG: phosphotransferase [Gemmatimonadota bacterium]
MISPVERARRRIGELFAARYGRPPERVSPVAADASSKRYFRLAGPGGETAIGAYGPDPGENLAFLSFSRTFRDLDLPVPEIYASDPEAGVWLEEDLGDTTLFDLLARMRRPGGESPEDTRAAQNLPDEVVGLYRQSLEILPRFQLDGGREIDFDVAYPRAAFDRQSILWDLNYFKYHFLKLAHIPFSEGRLERDFARLTGALLEADTAHFLYRDFQSRNIMVRDGRPWFIDYQGGRRGALQYDVASLLYDAKADLSPALRDSLLEHYLAALAGRGVDPAGFRGHYGSYVLVRLMQALGAYGYRGFYERKPHFLQSVPYAARNLEGILEEGLPVRLPELEAVFGRIVEVWARAGAAPSGSALTVRIGSFAYAGGYPVDREGHGGGFVFDCRVLPNPGREAAFRAATGLDEAVARYLRERPEVEAFFTKVRELVDAQILGYLRRRFASLSVQFGCTGGQHRSVYLAERLASHVRETFPQVEVRVRHRELGLDGRGSGRGAGPPETGSGVPEIDSAARDADRRATGRPPAPSSAG